MRRGILDVVRDSVSLSDMMIAERHGNDGSPSIAAGAGLEQRRLTLRLTLGEETHSLSEPINLEDIEGGRDLIHSYSLTISTPTQLITGILSTCKLSVPLVFSPVNIHRYNMAGAISRRQYLAQVQTMSRSHFATPNPNTVDQSKTTGDAGGLCSGSVDQSHKMLGRCHCGMGSHIVNDCWAIWVL
jgi:hypothetical protein